MAQQNKRKRNDATTSAKWARVGDIEDKKQSKAVRIADEDEDENENLEVVMRNNIQKNNRKQSKGNNKKPVEEEDDDELEESFTPEGEDSELDAEDDEIDGEEEKEGDVGSDGEDDEDDDQEEVGDIEIGGDEIKIPKQFQAQIDEIKQIEARVLESTKNLNDVLRIFSICKESDVCPVILACLRSLYNIFSTFLQKDSLLDPSNKNGTSNDKLSDAKQKIYKWLYTKLQEYKELLLAYLFVDEPGLQVPSLKMIFAITRHEYEHRLDRQVFAQVLKNILLSQNAITYPLPEVVVSTFRKEFLSKFADFSYLTFKSLSDMVYETIKAKATKDNAVFCKNVFSLVHKMTTKTVPAGKTKERAMFTMYFPVNAKSPDARNTVVARQKDAFDSFWTAFVKIPNLPEDIHKQLLLSMNDYIFPYMGKNSLLLVDFLTNSYDKGGIISLLSLQCLFFLIQTFNLDYPKFYDKLYALLEPNLFYVKHRVTFFKLFAMFMTSTALPLYQVMAFIKKLARLALIAPPSGALLIIPLIYNLLLSHDGSLVLIHKTPTTAIKKDASAGTNAGAGLLNLKPEFIAATLGAHAAANNNLATITGHDPFIFEEKDMHKSRANESSLWEIKALNNHYNPDVARMSLIFEQKLNPMQRYNLDDFINLSYSSLFDTLTKRQKNKKTPLAFDPRSTLFSPNEDAAFKPCFTFE